MISDLPNAPLKLAVDLWNLCNFECVHCSQTSGPRESRHSWNVDSFRALLAGAKAAGIHSVTFLGGEPTLHPKIFWCLEQSREAGLHAGIVSNGFLIDRAFAAQLSLAGCSEVALSIYGDRPEFHDPITAHPGSWEGIRSAAEALRAERLPVRCILMVTSLNVRAMREKEFWQAVEHLTPRWVRIINLLPMGRGAASVAGFAARPEEYVATFNTLSSWTFPFRVTMSRFYFSRGPSPSPLPRCGDHLGRVPAVMRDGSFRPCCTLSGLDVPAQGWSVAAYHALAQESRCPHLSAASGDFEIRCPIAETEFPTGPRLAVSPPIDNQDQVP